MKDRHPAQTTALTPSSHPLPNRLLTGITLFLLGSTLLTLGLYAIPMPYFDQWTGEGMLVLLPWIEGRLDWAQMLGAFNEHHIFTTRVLDILLFELNHHVWNVVLHEVVNGIIHVATLVLLLYLLLPACPPPNRRNFLLASTLVLAIPVGWENLLCSMQTQLYGMLLFSLLFIGRIAVSAPLSRGWWLAWPWALLAFFSQAPSVVSIAAGAVLTLAQLRHPGRRWQAAAGAALLFALAALCYLHTPMPDTATRHAYQAASLWRRVAAFNEVLGWPLFPFCGAIIWLPFAAFLWQRRRTLPEAGPDWLLACIGLWLLAHCAGIAWGRAPVPMAPRYQDLFVLGLPVNLVSLWRVLEKNTGSPKRREWVLAGWCGAIVLGMVMQTPAVLDNLAERRAQGLAQIEWIKAYRVSLPADRAEYGQGGRHAPPDLEDLRPFLDQPALLRTLPEILPDTSARQAGWVRWLLAHLELLGIVLMLAGAAPCTYALGRDRQRGTGSPS
jgi:hypothetical protein